MKAPLSFARRLLDHWRGRARMTAIQIFSPPYLPTSLVPFFLLTLGTQLAVILMSYSPSYWHNSLRAKGIAPPDAFEADFLTWLVFSLVYLSVAVFCLLVFNYRWSLMGWLTAEVIHFYIMGNWLNNCNYSRWLMAAKAFCDAFDLRAYWAVVAFLLGLLAATNLHAVTDATPWKQLKNRTPRLFAMFSIIWSVLLLWGIASSAQRPASGWVPLELNNAPPPLQGAAYAYDTKRNRLVVFGGATEYAHKQWIYKNETWEWDGEKWINVSPPLKDSPPARAEAGMAYDEERGVAVLYGGSYKGRMFCDTWEWNGERWISKCPPDCPGARHGHEMYYDSARKKIVLYGGYDNRTFFNDMWEWDGSTWVKIEPEGDSPAASGYALAYNPDGEFAFGVLSGLPGGTWIFDDDHWTRLSVTKGPGNRTRTGLAYEPTRKFFVAFGGYANQVSLNDTWFFDGKDWNLFTATKFQPPVRLNMILWYDRVRKHVMLFGGYHNDIVYRDTWELILPNP